MAEGAVCFSASALQMEGSRQGGSGVDGPLAHLERPPKHSGARREDRAGKTKRHDQSDD